MAGSGSVYFTVGNIVIAVVNVGAAITTMAELQLLDTGIKFFDVSEVKEFSSECAEVARMH